MSLQGLDLQKVDGRASPAESFNRDLDFYTVVVTGGETFRADGQSPALDSVGVPVNQEQYLFNKMVEVISLKAQPILLSIIGGLGTGRTTFNFVTEHRALWTEGGATDAKAESLDTVLTAEILAIEDDAGNQIYSTGPFAVTVTAGTELAIV